MTNHNCFFHLMMIFQLYSSLLFILFSYIQVKNLALESNFGTDEIAHDQCKPHFPDPKKKPKSTIEIFHIYGTCSPAAGTSPINMPSAQDILHRDRLRVESLQARLKLNSTINKYDSRFQDTKEVAYLSVLANTNNYAISISLGTPQQMQTLVFDTGSDITWTRGFHHYASTSFDSVPCNSDSCTRLLPDHTCEMFTNKENMCYYKQPYMDGSSTKGVFSMDILTITETDVFPGFLFNYAIEVEGYFDANGILGLGKKDVSFVNQTFEIYKGMFSYCLPSSPSSTGFLKLGEIDYSDNVKFTPLLTNPKKPASTYSINITSIKVTDVELLIGGLDLMFPAGIIIDTGALITYLPQIVYSKMRYEFKKQLRVYGYRTVPPIYDDSLDTCYDNIIYQSNIVPNITFTFEGGVTVDMDASTTLYDIDNLACLAFTDNSELDDFAVFGSTQQKKLEVVYDVYGGKLGFIPHRCL